MPGSAVDVTLLKVAAAPMEPQSGAVEIPSQRAIRIRDTSNGTSAGVKIATAHLVLSTIECGWYWPHLQWP
jgi:hypothetical protein